MRMLRVLVIGTFLIFTTTIGWYISQPVVFGFSRTLNATAGLNANARNAITTIEYISIAWGPVMILFILLWMIVSASKRDIESEIYP